MKINLRSMTIGLAWSLLTSGVVNWLAFTRKPACFDCAFPRGVPFTLFYDYGFSNGGVLWKGVIADILFAFGTGAIVGLVI
jgi:hypothetical protein